MFKLNRTDQEEESLSEAKIRLDEDEGYEEDIQGNTDAFIKCNFLLITKLQIDKIILLNHSYMKQNI